MSSVLSAQIADVQRALARASKRPGMATHEHLASLDSEATRLEQLLASLEAERDSVVRGIFVQPAAKRDARASAEMAPAGDFDAQGTKTVIRLVNFGPNKIDYSTALTVAANGIMLNASFDLGLDCQDSQMDVTASTHHIATWSLESCPLNACAQASRELATLASR